jgi:hypothetical protein
MTNAPTGLNHLMPNRASKNSGIVMESRRSVMSRVRAASNAQHNVTPMSELPTAMSTAYIPKPQPSLPAKPTNNTAEKYVVP